LVYECNGQAWLGWGLWMALWENTLDPEGTVTKAHVYKNAGSWQLYGQGWSLII